MLNVFEVMLGIFREINICIFMYFVVDGVSNFKILVDKKWLVNYIIIKIYYYGLRIWLYVEVLNLILL